MISLKENKTLADQHFESLKDFIIDRIDTILTQNHFIDQGIIALNADMIALIEPYRDEATLRKLLTSSANNLELKAIDSHLNHQDYIDSESATFKLLRRIFVDYGYNKINKQDFINNIGLNTCPYCNRNYIYVLDRGIVKPEIDHFYPQAIYPLFAACYYNLIPSCQTCNGIGGKHASTPLSTQITNPYLFNESAFRFSFKLNSLARINPISGKSSVDVILEKGILEKNNIVFKLDKLYAKHTDHVLELIVKSKLKYTPKYRAYLKSYSGLKFSETEIDQLILGNYSREKDIHRRPLAKLYQDIGRKLGLI